MEKKEEEETQEEEEQSPRSEGPYGMTIAVTATQTPCSQGCTGGEEDEEEEGEEGGQGDEAGDPSTEARDTIVDEGQAEARNLVRSLIGNPPTPYSMRPLYRLP